MKESLDPNHTERPGRDEQEEQAGSSESPKGDGRPGDDNLDFVVTEAHNQDHEFVGHGDKPKPPPEDDLGIESAADMMEGKALNDNSHSEIKPIGESNLSTPPPPDYSYQGKPQDDLEISQDNSTPPTEPDRIQRLSEEQVREISQKMSQPNKKSEYLTEDEKFDLIKNLDEKATEGKGFDNSPIVPPKRPVEDQPRETEPTPTPVIEDSPDTRPQMARRVRGVAYFTKSFIQITGEQELHEEDELTINGREYLLKRRRVSNKVLLGALGPLAAVLIFWIAALIVGDVNTGEGRVVGFVLDDRAQPVLLGASVHFPDIGKTYQANAQGFFKTDPMESGSMRVEYLYDDEVVGRDFATVIGGEITTVVLTPNVPADESAPRSEKPVEPVKLASASKPVRKAETRGNTPPPKPQPTKSTSPPARSSTPNWSKIALNANVDNARLEVDGSVLGAGNLTYSKLRPGEHTYRVSREGFEASEGTFMLVAGETLSLPVNLVPATAAAKRAVYDDEDFYYSAQGNVQRGDIETALEDLQQAIAKSPSYVDAYLLRARVFEGQEQLQLAYDDYIRAAEILRFRNEHNEAITAYNKAIQINPESIGAYIGRASLFLEQGQDIAAITDFEMALRLDDKNLQAHLGLGEARYNQGAYGRAIDHFKDARSISPEDPAIHQSLMLAYLADNDIKQVNECYEKYLKYASQEEAERLKTDPRFSAVMRVIED